jgi:acetyltransferase-like isoleucine patch superfamily enzyme
MLAHPFRILMSLVCLFLPWPLRRRALIQFLGFAIDPSAKIGYSLVLCERLIMKPRARILHYTVIGGVELLQMEEDSIIGNFNTIRGALQSTPYYKHQPERRAELTLGRHAAITSHHFLDCTNRIAVGQFTTIAGVRSTFLTHSVDFRVNRQDSGVITIGDYCFIGTDCTVLKGAGLPSYSILGAKSLLNKAFAQSGLYGGVPAKHIADLDSDLAYMSRDSGHVF